MNDSNIIDFLEVYPKIKAKCKETGFDMPSDVYIGTFLKTLVTSKPKSNILELRTGVGLSFAWMIDGLDNDSRLTTVDNDPKLIEIATGFFGKDERVKIVCEDGADWIRDYCGEKFDLIFADAWPGKQSELNETLDLVKVGGFYVMDDMTPQPSWPDGHAEKAEKLTEYLERRSDFSMTKVNWSTGLVLCTKRL